MGNRPNVDEIMLEVRKLLDHQLEKRAMALLGRDGALRVPDHLRHHVIPVSQSYGLSSSQRLKHLQKYWDTLDYIPSECAEALVHRLTAIDLPFEADILVREVDAKVSSIPLHYLFTEKQTY